MTTLDSVSPFFTEEAQGGPLLRCVVTGFLDTESEEQSYNSLQRNESINCRLREQHELRELLAINASLILITGPSGSGKTSLVLSVRDQFDYFCSGKFDQLCLATYMPFAAALSDLTAQLLTKLDDDQLQRLSKILPDAVNGETELLTAIIPAVRKIIPVREVSRKAPYQGTERMIRLRHVVACFLESICFESEKSILLFLDDLQWAEPESLEMLSVLLKRQIPGLQIVAACRSDEVPLESDLASSLRQMEDEGLRIADFRLGELQVMEVCQLISSASGLSKSQCHHFAEILHKQTKGNLFYSLELFRTLQSMGGVSLEKGNLCCDMEMLNLFRNPLTGGTINDVLTFKLRELSLDVQSALALASFMGAEFDSRLVCLALEQEEDLFLHFSALNKSSRLIVQVEQTPYYRFCHDKVQQACFDIFPETERLKLFLDAGRTLLDRLQGTEGVEENSVLITHLLSHSLHLVRDSVERVNFAELFFYAGRCLLRLSCFSAAANKFQDARELLPLRHWRDQYDLSLSIYTASAEVEQVVGHCDTAEKLAQEIISNSRSFFDSVLAYTITINSYTSQSRFDEGVHLGLKLLRGLKVALPRRAGKLQIALDVIKTKRQLKKFSINDVLSLPMMTCREKRAAMDILAQTFTCAFISKSPHQVLLSMAMIRLTLKYGLNSASVTGFAVFSVVMSMMPNENELASQYGQLTLDIIRKNDARAWLSRTYTLVYGLTFTGTMSTRNAVDPLMDGYRAGLASGDIASSTASLYLASLFRLFGSEPINELLQLGIEYRKVFDSFRHDDILILVNILLQTMENLLGQTEDSTELSGTFLNQREAEKSARRQENRAAQSVLCLCSLIVAFTMNDFIKAELIYDYVRSIPSVQSAFSKGCVEFFGGSAKLILARYIKTGRRRRLSQGRRCLRFVRKRAENVAEDHKHQLYLMEALLFAVKAKTDRALASFNEAASCSDRGNSFLHRALVSEQRSSFLKDIGRDDEALESLIQAAKTYSEWGCRAKTEQLKLDPIMQKSSRCCGSTCITVGSDS